MKKAQLILVIVTINPNLVKSCFHYQRVVGQYSILVQFLFNAVTSIIDQTIFAARFNGPTLTGTRGEPSGSVVECLTRERGAMGSSVTELSP